MREQTSALRFQPLLGAGRLLCRWRARAPFAQCGLFGCKALACAGHRTQHGFDYLGDNVKRADLMRHIPEHLPEGLGIERRAIGGDTDEGQVARHQGHFQTPQKVPDVVVGGIVI